MSQYASLSGKLDRMKRFYRRYGLGRTVRRVVQKGRDRILAILFPPWSVAARPLVHLRILWRRLVKNGPLPLKSASMRRLEALKDRHRGERCFIACTGPSLCREDLELLKDEVTFGMNTIPLIYPETDWRPTYYVAVDNYILGDFLRFHEIGDGRYSRRESFFSTLMHPLCRSEDQHFCLIHCGNHRKKNMAENRVLLSEDPAVCIYDCFTVTVMAIQLAIHMGLRGIYLLGADCNYSSGRMHFIETEFDRRTRGDEAFYSEAERLNRVGYRAAGEFAERMGCRIFNATRGGMLEEFPRITLEDALRINDHRKDT
jgi:hypothetical protein